MTPAEHLEQITKEIALHKSDGNWLSETKIELASLFSYFSGQLEEVLYKKPSDWNALRETAKSDKATDHLWDATEDGKKEAIFRSRCRRIEKLMSAITTQVRNLSDQAHNLM